MRHRKNKRVLSVFHNRQHDGNFRLISKLIGEDRIGKVTDIEVNALCHAEPTPGWYSDESRSGGILFTWGPHALDWIFRLLPGDPVAGVDSWRQKRSQLKASIDNAQRVILRFASGATAELCQSFVDFFWSERSPRIWVDLPG